MNLQLTPVPTPDLLGKLNPVKVQTLAWAIATFEGFFAKAKVPNVPQRLNNPGDLIFLHQRNAVAHTFVGADGKARTFCQFDTIEHGWEALFRQIKMYADRVPPLTIASLMRLYAPSDDGNDPKSYAAFIAEKLECQVNDNLLSVLEQAPKEKV